MYRHKNCPQGGHRRRLLECRKEAWPFPGRCAERQYDAMREALRAPFFSGDAGGSSLKATEHRCHKCADQFVIWTGHYGSTGLLATGWFSAVVWFLLQASSNKGAVTVNGKLAHPKSFTQEAIGNTGQITPHLKAVGSKDFDER